MNVFVTNISALSYWRVIAANDWQRPAAVPGRAFANCATTKEAYLEVAHYLAGWLPVTCPLHVSIPHASARPRSDEIVCHAVRGVVPDASFYRIHEGIYVSSPERCFVELSSMLSLDELVLLGFELCGRYVFTPNGSDGYTEIAVPLTSAAKLQEVIRLSKGVNGLPKAREALKWVLDFSRSPMETISEQRIVRPVRAGGCNVPIPKSNAPFVLSSQAAKMARRDKFDCDLIWPDKRVVLEYDSKEHHSDPEQAAYDAERASIIEFDGGSLISITPRIEQDLRRFEAMVRRLFKLLGMRYRNPTPEQMCRKMEFRRELYAAEECIKSLTVR